MLDELKSLDTTLAARWLLGKKLIRIDKGKRVGGMIVETEAYLWQDAASHSFRGQTQRNNVMFGPPGYLYVYFTYGMHYCVNVVTAPAGQGEAVLIRALEPTEGIDLMQKRRMGAAKHNLTDGPAKLAQAMGINIQLNGHYLGFPPVVLEPGREVLPSEIVVTTRIGIKKAANLPYRYYIKDSPFISKP